MSQLLNLYTSTFPGGVTDPRMLQGPCVSCLMFEAKYLAVVGSVIDNYQITRLPIYYTAICQGLLVVGLV
jgi:hypothetical protein